MFNRCTTYESTPTSEPPKTRWKYLKARKVHNVANLNAWKPRTFTKWIPYIIMCIHLSFVTLIGGSDCGTLRAAGSFTHWRGGAAFEGQVRCRGFGPRWGAFACAVSPRGSSNSGGQVGCECILAKNCWIWLNCKVDLVWFGPPKSMFFLGGEGLKRCSWYPAIERCIMPFFPRWIWADEVLIWRFSVEILGARCPPLRSHGYGI